MRFFYPNFVREFPIFPVSFFAVFFFVILLLLPDLDGPLAHYGDRKEVVSPTNFLNL